MLSEFGLSDIQCSWWWSACTDGIGMSVCLKWFFLILLIYQLCIIICLCLCLSNGILKHFCFSGHSY